MDIKVLESFIKVAECLNFTDAANQLFLSQSTLSRQINELEKELNTKLFFRNHHSVCLTDPGSVFLSAAKNILTEYNHTLFLLDHMQNAAESVLRIGFWGNPFYAYIPPLVNRFRNNFPGVQISLQNEEPEVLLEHLNKNELDIVFGTDWMGDQKVFLDLNRKIIGYDRFVAVLSPQHPLANRSELSLCELNTDFFVLLSQDTLYQRVVTTLCNNAGFFPIKFHYARNIREAMIYVESGCGVSILMESQLDEYKYKTAIIPLKEQTDYIGKKMVFWTKSNTNPTLTNFLSLLPVKNDLSA